MYVYITQLDVHSDNNAILIEIKFKPLAYLDGVSKSKSYTGIVYALQYLIGYWCAWFRLDPTYFWGCNIALIGIDSTNSGIHSSLDW